MATPDLEDLLRRKDLAAAEDACRRLLAERPDDAAVWEFCGRAALASGDLAAAETSFNRAVDLDPQAPSPVFGLAMCCARRQRLGKAGKHALKALKLGLTGDDIHRANVWVAGFSIAGGD